MNKEECIGTEFSSKLWDLFYGKGIILSINETLINENISYGKKVNNCQKH